MNQHINALVDMITSNGEINESCKTAIDRFFESSTLDDINTFMEIVESKDKSLKGWLSPESKARLHEANVHGFRQCMDNIIKVMEKGKYENL